MTSRSIRPVVPLISLVLTLGAAVLDGRQQPREAAPAPAAGTAIVSGIVMMDDDSVKPLRSVNVTITGATRPDKEVAVTDDNGRFVFTKLPGGSFSLEATRPGYTDATRGRYLSGSHSASARIAIVDGDRKDVTLYLARGAVLAGRILDASGQPTRDVSVQASRVRIQGGQRVADRSLPLGSRFFARTDDTGSYRLWGLPPGDYVINAAASGQVEARPVSSAEIQWAQSLAQRAGQPGGAAPPPPPTSAASGYAPVFYGGTSDPAAATIVTLAKGEERQALDFSLQPVPLARIEGTLLDVDGRAVSGIEVSLLNTPPTEWSTTSFTGIPASRTDAGGIFRFSRVLPGTYTLAANLPASSPSVPPGAAAPPRGWARGAVVIDGNDLLNVSLRSEKGLMISGRILFDGSSPSDARAVGLTLIPATSVLSRVPPPARVDADGGFDIRDVLPGRYWANSSVRPAATEGTPASSAPKWILKSVSVDGADVLDLGLEISTTDLSNVVVTFTDHPGELSGRLVDARNQPVFRGTVVLFSTDRKQWRRRVRTTQTDQDGVYSIAPLLAGEYYLCVYTEDDGVVSFDVSLLDELIPRAVKIVVAEGEKKKQDLKLSGGSPD